MSVAADPAVAIALLAGNHSPELLHNARLHGWGKEHFGEEAILAAFRADPHAVSDSRVTVVVPGHLAVFDEGMALIATVGEGGLQRLWRLGPGEPAQTEPRIDAPFDPDLSQARGDVLWRAADHPALPDTWHVGIAAAGQEVTRTTTPEGVPYRARAFLMQAFGDVHGAVALFAVHRLAAGAARTASFVHVAARIGAGGTTLCRDHAGERAVATAGWRPRF